MPKTTHTENLVALKRIEGQVKGIQKMITEGKYCVDIVIQIQAAVSALQRVAEKIFAKHIETCVADALQGKSKEKKQQKINEVIDIIRRIHKFK